MGLINSGPGELMCEAIACNTMDLESLANATELACIKLLKVLDCSSEEIRTKFAEKIVFSLIPIEKE